ncbi:MAG: TonB-dependent receptor plug domain-containing protein [Candidatus Saccharicenans sp.]|uniref:TonB-dependent receptor plug domain-containing protein n=1 Tax=Candidatus Saccharicenans sp. TaxID=2819258 RepID=UPI0040494620
MRKSLSAQLAVLFSVSLLFIPFLRGFLIALPADDQTQPPKIQHEIVVTATRLETPVKETASAISLVRTEKLPPGASVRPEILFAGVPGLFFIQTGLAGGVGSIFIRGANSEHAMVMIDGLELNDPVSPSRSFNFNLFNLSLVDQVEILRGPQSTLYGSDALAGVVNLITAEPERNEIKLTGLFGSLKTGQTNFRISRTRKNFFWLAELNASTTAGISQAGSRYPGNNEADGYSQQSLALKFSYRLSPSFRLSWQSRGLLARAELDAFGGPYGDDPNSRQKSSFIFNRLELDGFFLHHRWEQKLIFGLEASRRENDNPADELHPEEGDSALYRSRLFKIDWQNNLFLAANQTLVFGADFRQEQGSSSYLYFSPWGNYESHLPKTSAYLFGLYLQDQWKPWKRLSLTAGLRSDHHRRFGQALTFRTAVCLDLPEIGARIKSTVGSGFKAPSLYQLYAPVDYLGLVGNQDLKPERNLGWDVGLEKEFGNSLAISLTYFESRYRNLIQFYFGSGYQNIGRARSRGLEATLEAQLLRNINLGAGWTHLRAKDLDSGSQLLRRPENTLHLRLNLTRQSLGLAAELNYIGSRLDLDYSSYPPRTAKLRAATLANLFLSYDLKSSLTLFLHLQNLFNARYELIYGYGAPGTTISTGFKLKL